MFKIRKISLITLITVLCILMLSGIAFSQDNNVGVGATAIGAGNNAMGQGQGQMINGPLIPPGPEVQTMRGNRPFGTPGGLILPGFPTNVDTNGGPGAMYLDTRTQLLFKNTWTAEELKDGNEKWCGNEIHVSMYVSKVASSEMPPLVRLDYIRKVKNDSGIMDVLPLDTQKYEYRFTGYVFARAKSPKLMAPENTIDASREMRKYGANFAIVLNDGVEKTMIASSFGAALGYTGVNMSHSEQASSTAVAGIGAATGKSGMRGFPWLQMATFKRTLKVEKTAVIIPPKEKAEIKPVIVPAKEEPTMPRTKPQPVKYKTNIKNYVPNLVVD
jgi:hypothetical protein